MVRALLAGIKTQTRRIIKPQPDTAEISPPFHPKPRAGRAWVFMARDDAAAYSFTTDFLIAYAPGDRIWVREDWRVERACDDLPPSALSGEEFFDYLATRTERYAYGRTRHAIHMPRWASRLTLTVSDVRVQRLQDISEEDAQAEGATSRPACHGFLGRDDGWSMDWSRVGEMSRWAHRKPGGPAKAPLTEADISLGSPRMAFASYWNSIHGADAWEDNPWVAAITFSVEHLNIDWPYQRHSRKYSVPETEDKAYGV